MISGTGRAATRPALSHRHHMKGTHEMSNDNHAALSAMGSTFAERAAYRAALIEAGEKAVKPDDVEDKAVTSATSKARKAPARKKG